MFEHDEDVESFEGFDEAAFERLCAGDPERSALRGDDVSDFELVAEIIKKDRAIARLQAQQYQLGNILCDRYVTKAVAQRNDRDLQRAQGVTVAPEKAFAAGFEQASTEDSMALRIPGSTASTRLDEGLELRRNSPRP